MEKTSEATHGKWLKAAIGLGLILVAVDLVGPTSAAEDIELEMPWRQAGLTERQAAAHLLSRLAYGPRPGEIDRVVEMGLERWVSNQLKGNLPDSRVDSWLSRAKSLDLSAREIAEAYPNPGLVRRRAVQAGVVEQNPQDSGPRDDSGISRQERRAIRQWAEEQGYRPSREATYELMTQKLARATFSENQLTEVLTDFWFNHFNVSITDNQARIYVWPYERDAIRPHVTGQFRDMLEATAKHPAMLHYLDNVRSTADADAKTTLDLRRAAFENNRRGRRAGERRRQGEGRNPNRPGRSEGLNENYARELMELHTLGVDGGYGQQDVVEVARAFTGWATYPPDRSRRQISERLERARRFPQAGFVIEESFIFRADAHDAGAKTVLGHKLPAGQGIEDGMQVLDILAAHPSTARHLSTKFAARFVSDEPPEPLVDRLAETFTTSDGRLDRLVITLVESPEFWAEDSRQAKIKSPFEVVVSSLRVLGAEVDEPRGIYDWIRRMGQPLYAYQAPTGYPDRAGAWVNTGALLNRMNFGLQVATGQVPGVKLDLPALAGGREPASLDAALDMSLPRGPPERDGAAASERLRQVIHDPKLAEKIADAAPSEEERESGFGAMDDDWDVMAGPGAGRRRAQRPPSPTEIDHSPVAQVVGVILGSPDFQRR